MAGLRGEKAPPRATPLAAPAGGGQGCALRMRAAAAAPERPFPWGQNKSRWAGGGRWARRWERDGAVGGGARAAALRCRAVALGRRSRPRLIALPGLVLPPKVPVYRAASTFPVMEAEQIMEGQPQVLCCSVRASCCVCTSGVCAVLTVCCVTGSRKPPFWVRTHWKRRGNGDFVALKYSRNHNPDHEWKRWS